MKASVQWKYPEAIVEPGWLNNQLGSQEIRVYDCTTYLHYTDDHPMKPYDVESGLKDYKENHIPSAAFLDLQNDLSEGNSPYSFTLPNPDKLAIKFKRRGIGDPYHIVLYSRNGMQWSTRVWWMLHVLGYDNVSILNGGFIEWNRLSFPTEHGEKNFAKADFQVTYRPDIFVGKERVLEAMGQESSLLLNALTEDLHKGENPRYGRPGRIPDSINIPFHNLIDPSTGKLKTPEEAAQVFAGKAITSDMEIINYCGGGIAATLDAFVLYQLGFPKLQIYDNSMSEWAMDKELPIETG